MVYRLRLAQILAIAFLGAIGSASRVQAGPDERTAIYQWVDSLEFDAMRNGQFGVVTSRMIYTGTDRGSDSSEHGFLVNQSGRSFEVLTEDLSTKRFPGSSFGNQVTGEWRPADFVPWAEIRWKELKDKPDDANALSRDVLALVIFSRTCAARGIPTLADKAYEEAQSRNSEERVQPGMPLIERLRKEYKEVAKYEATGAFDDPSASRKLLLAKFQRWLRLFPEDPDAYMHESAELLATMIKEDEAHVKVSDPELVSLPTDQRVRELVYRLRDLSGHQYTNPGDVYFVGDRFGGEAHKNSPASQLQTLGLAAVPQLIEALSDRRFTRAMRMMRQAEYQVPRVQDAAFQILCEIAHQQFDPRTDGTIYFGTSEAEPYEVQQHRFFRLQWEGRLKLVKKWWSEVESKGEKQALISSVEQGNNDSVQAAQRLVEIDAASLLPAVQRGLSKIEAERSAQLDLLNGIAAVRRREQLDEDRWIAKELFETIAPITTKEAREFAKDRMLNAHGVDIRIEAAQLYLKWDPGLAAESMSRELERLMSATPGESANDAFSDRADLVRCLAQSGRASAIGLLRRAVDSQAIDEAETLRDLAPLTKPAGNQSPADKIERSKYESEVESLLASRLLRLDYCPSSPEERYSKLAGEQLALNWPSRYAFDGKGSFEHVRGQCIQCLNIWRHTQGLAPVVLEKTKSVTSGPARALAAQRGVSTVREVVVVGAAPNCAKTFIKRLNATRGKTLTVMALSDLLQCASDTWTPNSLGFSLVADRDAESDGFVLTLQFFNSAQQFNGNDGWSYSASVDINGQQLTGGGGSGSLASAVPDGMGKAFASPREASVRINIAASLKRGSRN